MKTCIDLFSGLGGFSQAFQDDEGWEVVTVDIEEDFDPDICTDVRDLEPGDLPREPDLVLASPPCTCFSLASNRIYWSGTGLPKDPRVTEAVKLVYHTLFLIHELDPDFWFLENPRGKLRKVMPLPPTGTVTYCQYGFPWQKPTDLWGNHPSGMVYRSCSPGEGCHQSSGRGFDSGAERSHVRDPAERAKVPYGLSKAILDTVKNFGGADGQTSLWVGEAS